MIGASDVALWLGAHGVFVGVLLFRNVIRQVIPGV